jgi:hypothetical protein
MTLVRRVKGEARRRAVVSPPATGPLERASEDEAESGVLVGVPRQPEARRVGGLDQHQSGDLLTADRLAVEAARRQLLLHRISSNEALS